MKSVPAIAFDYRPSRWLLYAIAAMAILAFAAIAVCGLSIASKLALIALAAAYAAHARRTFLHPPYVQVMWHSAGHWRLADAGGREQVGELARAVALGALTVLILRTGPKRTTALALLPDNCDAETRRKLRVRLARADSIDSGG